MTPDSLLLFIIIPLAGGLSVLAIPQRYRGARDLLVLFATFANLAIALILFKSNIAYTIPWSSFGIEFSFRLYNFSAFIISAAAGFGFLISLYSTAYMRDRSHPNQFYAYLLVSLGLFNGAVLADNLVAMIFFWEGMLVTLFGMIAIGNKGAFKTATKAFIIEGAGDLSMMIGVAMSCYLAGTSTTSEISLSVTGLGGGAFALLMIGAIAKAGSMPFHSWIPDAAIDAPTPFMAILPASLDKLLGIYFLARISLDMFRLAADSWASYLLMIIGSLTILLAVMMALIQKNYKRLLAYHAISQVGYMILGIGTALPAGIIGGLFHMINNALYKSGLFLTGGSVEKQAGTADLEKLGGIGLKMPVTFVCFLITAASISGVPPFNGFFSKELVYDGALERGMIFYLAAVIGSFFTAASFLKLGHSAFLGKLSKENENVREAPFQMTIPMIVIAITCIFFGLFNSIPINKFIQPILGEQGLEGRSFAGFPANKMLVVVTVAVLIGALLNHIYGVKRTGSGLKAVDHIHYAPFLSFMYDKAEKRRFDPYDIGLKIIRGIAAVSWRLDRLIDWFYNEFIVGLAHTFSNGIRRLHDGSHKRYIIWSVAGALAIILFLLRG